MVESKCLIDDARGRLREVLAELHNEDRTDLALRVVGSLGIYSLVGKEPKIIRKPRIDQKGKKYVECVDIDLLVGWNSYTNPKTVKEWADHVWQMGMNDLYDVRFPVSVINLPKDVANDPNAVLGFMWRVDERRFWYQYRDNRVKELPYSVVDNIQTGNIFDLDINTLTPEGHLWVKLVSEYRNPLRVLKMIDQLSILKRKFPELEMSGVGVGALNLLGGVIFGGRQLGANG